MTKRGYFITLEGCEGVGKSTQLNMLKDYLIASNQSVIFTREPGGTAVAEDIRKIILSKPMDALTEAYLFAAARIEHIKQVITPALERGQTVICDRYIDSSLAYQGVARGLGIDNVVNINAYARDYCMPDATIFIDMNPNNSWRKQDGEKIFNDRMEQESSLFHQLVYDGFKQLEVKYDRIIPIIPNINKTVTSNSIITALIKRGVIS